MKLKGHISKNRKILTIVIGLVLTGASFIALTNLSNKMAHPLGTQDVIIANTDLKKGTVITEKNLKSSFKVKENADKTVVANNAITDINKLIGTVIEEDISQNEIITKNDFISKDSILGKIKNRREISIELNTIGDGVGGLLRGGDIVDIYVGDNETKESTIVLQNVYVDKVLSASGVEVSKDNETSASIINIIIDESNVALVESAKQRGDLTFSKVD